MSLERACRNKHASQSFTTAVLLFYTLLAVAGIAISRFRLDPIEYGPSLNAAGWAIISGLGLSIIVVLASRGALSAFEWAKQLHTEFRNLLGTLSPGDIAVLATASAVGEELLFRGALLPWLGIWPQAIIFGLLHIGPSRRFLPWTVMSVAIGYGFGWLYVDTGSILAPITAHFAINFINLRHITRVEIK